MAHIDVSDPGDDTPSVSRPPRWHAIVAAVATGLRVLSSPMERLTVKQRDTIGWIALNIVFLAVCVWLYTLLK